VFAVDYARVLLGLARPLDAGAVGVAILAALVDRYDRQCCACALHEFQESGATYLFDLASAVAATQEDRTVGAWTVTPPTISGRDVSYQRGFPLAPGPDGTAVCTCRLCRSQKEQVTSRYPGSDRSLSARTARSIRISPTRRRPVMIKDALVPWSGLWRSA
jgi:hypothetical protein